MLSSVVRRVSTRTSLVGVRRSAPAAFCASSTQGQGVRSLHVTGSAQYKAPLQEVAFLANDVYNIQDHYKELKVTGGQEATAETVDFILEEMGRFCEQELAPLNESGDTHGCKHVDAHTVNVPPGFKEAYDTFTEGGWQGLSYPEEYGGQGMPYSLALMSTEMAATANWTWTMYPGLSKGAINTILSHGTDELKEKYLPPLVSGEWTGTMCLTEPQCGSDLAQVTTRAEPQGDGTYKITGTKIFISCGDHDMVDNIIHCVLARLPGAPPGTKGISLFLVPKRKVNDDGSNGDLNGVNIGRIEDKMGCHGSSTCEINFEDAEGFLIGTENRGLNHMFTFINTSRLGTAVQGVAATEASYQNALQYAKERLAMRSLTGDKNPSGPADPIIVHPDVRRMLLTMKAVAEGGRSMIYECALITDTMMEAKFSGDDAAERAADDKMGFLTPILKGFLTEIGVDCASMGMQVYGGHGYIKQNHQEQIFRDARISALWEGTTGIQALDLLGRKILMHGKLKPIQQHCAKLRSKALSLITSGSSTSVKRHALSILCKSLQWQAYTVRIALAGEKNADAIGVASYDYLMYSGYVQLAYHWLIMEETATKALNAKGDRAVGDDEFYKAKIQTAAFVFDNLLPRTKSHATTMMTPVNSLMGLKEDHFSFDY